MYIHTWNGTNIHEIVFVLQLNKRKRLFWCKEQLCLKETFDNVIFTDESTIQLDHHNHICFRKKLQPRALKQRAKYPVKIHIWGGISKKGATRVVMFTGNMNAIWLRRLFEGGLVPFINELFPTGYRLYQDNDPKHRSEYISDFFEEMGINWWPIPP